MQYIYIIITSFTILSCGKKEDKELVIQPTDIVKMENELILKNFSYEDVAKYVISVIMLEPDAIIKSDKKDDLYIVSYTRESDKQKFIYKVKFDHNKAIWANIDGRWRDTQADEKITFEETGEKLKIHVLYSDGSAGTEEFTK